MNKQLAIALLKYGLGVGLLAWVLWSNRVGLADAAERPFDWQPMVVAFLLYQCSMLLTFFRWHVLVRAQDLPIDLANSMRLGLIGFYLSTFLPGSVGGDIIKAAFLAREQKRRTVAVATVVVDRFIGLCGLFWLVALTGGIAWSSGYLQQVTRHEDALAALETIVVVALSVVAGSVSAWVVSGFVSLSGADRFAAQLERIPKVGHAFAELWRALYMYRRRGRHVAATLGMSIVGHVGFVLAFYFAAQTLSPELAIPDLATHFLIVPVGMTITAGFPAPGGVGGGELAFGELYHVVGFDRIKGVLGSLVQRVITWTLGLLGYLVYLRMKPAIRQVTVSEPAT